MYTKRLEVTTVFLGKRSLNIVSDTPTDYTNAAGQSHFF